MSLIYVLQADGSHARYEDDAVRQMLRDGTLSPQTLYWQEGLPEWIPLSGLESAAVPVQSLTANRVVGISNIDLIDDPRPRAVAAQVLLGIYLLVTIAFLCCAINQMSFVYATHVDLRAARFSDLMFRVVSFTSLGAYIATSIPFLMWVYRIHHNCRVLVWDVSLSSAMAVGSFFIPFANLVLPCLAMQEAWKVSNNPLYWRAVKASVLVGLWWAFWLLTCFTGEIFLFLPKVHDRGSLQLMTGIVIFLEAVKIVLSLLALTMIRKITFLQTSLDSRELEPPGLVSSPIWMKTSARSQDW